MGEDSEKKTIPQVSVDTQILLDRLVKAKMGDLIPYGELSRLIDKDVQNQGRSHLQSARNMALTQHRMVFECVWNQGVKRLDDEGAVMTGTHTLKKIRHAARKGARKVACVQNFEALPNDMKVKHNAFASVLGAVAHFSRDAAVKRIEGKVEEANGKLPLGRTLEAFK